MQTNLTYWLVYLLFRLKLNDNAAVAFPIAKYTKFPLSPSQPHQDMSTRANTARHKGQTRTATQGCYECAVARGAKRERSKNTLVE